MIGRFSAIWRQTFGRVRGTATSVLAWSCIAMFVAVFLLDRLNTVSQEQIFYLFGLSYDGVVRHVRLHQFITAALLHGSLAHLLFNMLTLWMLGPAIEAALGRGRYLFFSFFCAACGFAGFLLFGRGGGGIAIGYSGVIFGILVAQAVFSPNSVLYFFGLFPMRMKHAVLLLGAIALYMTLSPQRDGVAHAAHLFGALGAFMYLKLPSLWRGRWRAATPVMPVASDAYSRERTARDWGRSGEVLAEAVAAIGNGNYDDARRRLTQTRFLWRARRIARRVKRLTNAVERCSVAPGEQVRDKAERMTLALWGSAARKEMYIVLPAIANLGLQQGEGIIPLLVATLTDRKSGRMPTETRRVLEAVLGEAGSVVLEQTIPQLIAPATPDARATALLFLLPSMNLQKHASTIMKIHGLSSAKDQECLLTHLARLKDNAPGAVCDLLAGCLSRLPVDLRLARDLQARIGPRELERIASRWAAGGHRSAQVVLQRMYDSV